MPDASAATLFNASTDPGPADPRRTLQVQVEPDSPRAAHQVRLRHEAPVAAVGAVVAIITDHQVVAIGHGDFCVIAPIRTFGTFGNRLLLAVIATLDLAVAGRQPGGSAQVPGGAAGQGAVDMLAGMHFGQPHVLVAAIRVPAEFGLLQRLAIDINQVAHDADAVAGQPDQPLDVVHRRIRRVTEYHDVATLRISHAEYLGVQYRQTQAVVILVHQ